MDSINIFIQTRHLIEQVVAGLSDQQMRYIPPGFDNNIAWNLGHIVVVQQLLHYRLCGLEMAVNDHQIAMFRTGTSPADWQTEPDLAPVMALLLELPQKLLADYQTGRFGDFKPFTTSTGIYLETLEEAIAFNNFHEGLHLGFILSLRNLVDQ
ncbi:MAG: DinB family protein [Anaerolineae bacterium]|nr:DinB family protein [Anaerolineae bacterium]